MMRAIVFTLCRSVSHSVPLLAALVWFAHTPAIGIPQVIADTGSYYRLASIAALFEVGGCKGQAMNHVR